MVHGRQKKLLEFGGNADHVTLGFGLGLGLVLGLRFGLGSGGAETDAIQYCMWAGVIYASHA